jgi:drug/metabolite transporter (DMT)-like permease
LDRFWFKHPYSARQWGGALVGILAGYTVLGFPSLSDVAQFPPWVWFAFGNMLSLVLNQWIAQMIKDIHPYAKNVWGGGSTCLLGVVVCIIAGGVGSLKISMTVFVTASVAIGMVTFFMWAFSLFAYKEGAYISLKKLVMNASYMAMTVALSVILFGESFTLYHGLGFGLYLVAIIMMDEKVYRTLRDLTSRKTQTVL